MSDGLFKITVRISNVTATKDPGSPSRDEALMQSLLSAHTILASMVANSFRFSILLLRSKELFLVQ